MLALLPGLRSLSFWGHLRWRPWGKAWGHLHSSHTQLVFLPSLTPPLEIQSRIQSSYSSSGAWQRASGSCFNGTGYIVIGRLLSFSLLLGRLNRFAVSLIILLPGHIHRNTRYSPKGKAMQEKQLGPWWRWWRSQKAGCIRLSTTPASATSWGALRTSRHNLRRVCWGSLQCTHFGTRNALLCSWDFCSHHELWR